VREREEEAGALGREEMHVAVCVPTLLGGPPLYSGEGVHLSPPPKPPRAVAKEGPRAVAARVGWGQAGHPTYPSTLPLAG
jgi:hypothetical protein